MPGLPRNVLYLALTTSALGLAPCATSPAPQQGEPQQGEAPEPADLVLRGGRVYTLAWPEPGRDGTPSPKAPFADGAWTPDATAVAVRGTTIAYVGSDDGVLAYVGPDTEVIDLAGAVAIPGLVDAHTHVIEMGLALARADLVGIPTPEEAAAAAAAHAAKRPSSGWLFGQGFDEGAWANRYPTRALLDAHFPDRPVYLRGLHGFAGWLNSRALEALKIDGSTPDPTGGKILRDAEGEPTGIVVDNAVELVDAAVPQPTDEAIERAIVEGLERMAEAGFVGVHEAGVGHREMAALQRLEDAGQLPIRFYAMLRATDAEVIETYAEKGPELPTQGFLTVRAVKGFFDGSLGARGAALIQDYSDRPGHRGTGGAAYAFDPEVAARMMKAGFQVGIHAIGDAGNRETLDLFEAYGGPDLAAARHRIEHAQVLHPADLPRLGALGIIGSMNPPHAVEDMPWAEDRLGPERIRGAYAWRSLRESGAPLVFSSDLPGSDHSIFYGLHSAITRRNRRKEPAEGWYPEERMSAEEALRGYTSWAAFASFSEEHAGAIAPGRWADITVMSLDPLAVGTTAPGQLLEGKIHMTIVAGKIAFRSPR